MLHISLITTSLFCFTDISYEDNWGKNLSNHSFASEGPFTVFHSSSVYPLASIELSNVTVSGFTVMGDSSTNAGILIAPRSTNVTVDGNTISGMALGNPGNNSPLAYGVLTYGGSVYQPSGVTISNNAISGVHGSAISLGANTSGVTVSGNTISGLVPVLVEGEPFSVGVQAQFAVNVSVTGNTFVGGVSPDLSDALSAGVNLVSSQGSVSNNNYSGVVGSYFTDNSLSNDDGTGYPSFISFSDDEPYWIASTTAYSSLLGFNVTATSYASSLVFAQLVADSDSIIHAPDGSNIAQDCAGDWGGSSVEDSCGVCDADSTNDNTPLTGTCDCAGTPNGDAVIGCDDICGSGLTNDGFGICDGDGTLAGAIALGGTVTVPSGDYAPFAILRSDVTVACADGATCTVGASGAVTGITIGDPLANSIEVNSVILEAQKKKIRKVNDLTQIVKQVLNSSQKTILLVIYNTENQRRYIGIKLD